MNQENKAHFETRLEKGERSDGRGLIEFRDITIERGVSSTAHGSARLRAGNAEIIAGVKIEVGTPYDDTPDEGSLMVAAELTPLSHKKFEPGPPGIDSIEAARVIDRTIRESKTLDVKKLCIKSGEKIWFVIVDIMPVSYDGNMIDLGALAALAALQDARMPKLDENFKPDYEDLTDEHLTVEKQPIAITVFKVGDNLIVDPTEVEETMYDARVTIATLEDGKLCAMQKGGSASLSADELETCIDIAIEQGKKLREVLNA